MEWINLLPFDGEVYFFPDFLSKEESLHYFSKLKSEIDWKHEPVTIFGKKIMQPRLTALYGDTDKTYRYSGHTMKSNPWNEDLLFLKKKTEDFTRNNFTTVLLNYYRDQKDSNGWHRDNEKELGKNPIIASLSLGETRRFNFMHMKDKNKKLNLELPSGSIVLMRGETQKNWKHCVPKESKEKKERINLTFRNINNYI